MSAPEKDPAYPPEQRGYQPGYPQAPQAQGGYAPIPGGYPPAHQQGYPAQQQQGYPPQQQGYLTPGLQGYPPPAYVSGQQAPPPGVHYNPNAPVTESVIVRTTQGPGPNNYLGLAIFVTCCCCLPIGIIAIYHATQVNDKWNSGDRAGAQAASNLTKRWTKTGLISGILVNIFGAIIVVVYFVLGTTRGITIVVNNDYESIGVADSNTMNSY